MRTIDADKLVDMLYDNEFAVLCPLDEVSGVVDACPTVDAMPVVHGRWAHLGGGEWCCSACGFVLTAEGSWDKPTKKYCEDCGAKMDGGADHAAD